MSKKQARLIDVLEEHEVEKLSITGIGQNIKLCDLTVSHLYSLTLVLDFDELYAKCKFVEISYIVWEVLTDRVFKKDLRIFE